MILLQTLIGFYGAANEELEGNYGFLDQIMVMKWVKNNVGYFNGDPDRVTIDGHSAGAADVGFHMVSPLAKGIWNSRSSHEIWYHSLSSLL